MADLEPVRAERWRVLLVDLDRTLWWADAAYRAATRGRWDGVTSVADAAAACGFDGASWADEITRHCAAVTVASRTVDLLGEFHSAGGKVGCVTNLPAWVAVPMLDALDLVRHFDAFAFNEHGRPAKPHPDPVRRAVSALGEVALTKVLLVGDSDDDRECALSAGVAFGRVTWETATGRWGLGSIESGGKI